MSDSVLKFPTSPNDWLAYRRHARSTAIAKESTARQPGIVYVNGLKVQRLLAWASDKNLDLLVFDHFGHGQSSGDFKDATVGRWLEDLCLLLNKETKGPQILVGASMGFWLSLLVALRAESSLKRRVLGMVGIAPSLNFTETMMVDMTETNLEFEGGAGSYRIRSTYSSTGFYDIPITMLLEGKQHCVLPPYDVQIPVRLIHGLEDEIVPFAETVSLLQNMQSANVDLLLVKGGDHRLSRDEDLEKITLLLENLLTQVAVQDVEDEPVVWRDNPLQDWRPHSTVVRMQQEVANDRS